MHIPDMHAYFGFSGNVDLLDVLARLSEFRKLFSIVSWITKKTRQKPQWRIDLPAVKIFSKLNIDLL